MTALLTLRTIAFIGVVTFTHFASQAQNVYQIKIKTIDGERIKGYYSDHNEAQLRIYKKHPKKANRG